jgi:hypothetical protein
MDVELKMPSWGEFRVPLLPIAPYRVRFSSAANGKLPPFTGSVWRGASGHALRKTVCVTPLDSCPSCLPYRSCTYPYIFETPPPLGTGKMRRYTAAPHPFLTLNSLWTHLLAPGDLKVALAGSDIWARRAAGPVLNPSLKGKQNVAGQAEHSAVSGCYI